MEDFIVCPWVRFPSVLTSDGTGDLVVDFANDKELLTKPSFPDARVQEQPTMNQAIAKIDSRVPGNLRYRQTLRCNGPVGRLGRGRALLELVREGSRIHVLAT